MEINRQQARALVQERARRERQALRLYRPFVQSEAFHRAKIADRVIRGGNRSGKTTSAAVEFAHAATGIPLYGRDGSKIPDKYPRDRPLVLWILAIDYDHIGRTIYKKLFLPGAFDVIRDKTTGKMRAYDPTNPEDLARSSEKEPAPPLIPPDMIDPKGWAWENKSKRNFEVCRLKNGTEIRAYSSKGEPPQGDAVDGVWVDEDVADPKQIGELRTRLIDRGGFFWWSAWPHSKNNALMEMSERAEREADNPDASIREYRYTMTGNPYLPLKAVMDALVGMGEAERRIRDLGEYHTDNVLMYPSFNIKTLHGVHSPGCPERLRQALLDCNYRPPDTWTHYLILDPGHVQPAVMLGAVPPSSIGHFLVVWNEVYEPRVDARQLAKLVRLKAEGIAFHEMIFDNRAGRQTTLGYGKTVGSIYREAFAKEKIMLRDGSTEFIPGSDNKDARHMLVREAPTPRLDGTPTLILVEHETMGMQQEFRRYKKKIVMDEAQDVAQSGDDHLMDCLGYWLSRAPQWIRHASIPIRKSRQHQLLQAYLETHQRKGTGKFYAGAGLAPQGAR